MDNPEGRYHRASWLPVIAADILPIVRLDLRNERIHILDILHVDDSPDLLELFGSHQHVTCTRYGINDIHGRPAMFLDGLPEIVGKFGRHGISQGGRWMIPVYLNRLMKARNTEREPSIGSRPEDDGLLGQLVDSLSPSKSEKRRDFSTTTGDLRMLHLGGASKNRVERCWSASYTPCFAVESLRDRSGTRLPSLIQFWA